MRHYKRDITCTECGNVSHGTKEVMWSNYGIQEITELASYPVPNGIKCCDDPELVYSDWYEDRNKTGCTG